MSCTRWGTSGRWRRADRDRASIGYQPPDQPIGPSRPLQVHQIYAEPEARDSERGRQVLARFPGAEVIEVPSHWQIPELHGNAIGENSDCSVDALVSDNIADLIATFRELPSAKASFATKFVNRRLLDLDPQGRTRIRFSLMPEADSKLLDVRTSPIAERIAAIENFVEAGYEVHLNLSPVVLRDGWERDWTQLLNRLDDSLGPAFKQQAAAEIIMLTHNRELHEVNLGWHPKAEDVLWRPELQQAKQSQNGMWNVRYGNNHKRAGLQTLQNLIAVHTPWLRIRYAF